MKYGISNKLTTSNTTLTGSITAEAGKDEENILDEDTLYIYEFEEGDGTLLIEFTSNVDLDLISLFNVTCETSIKIDAYSDYSTTTIAATKTTTAANLCGLDYKAAFLEFATTTSIDAIKLTFAGTTATFLSGAGYIWAGEVIDLGCSEALKPSDISSDNVTITRANQPDIKEVYNYQAFSFTTKKENEYFTLRDDNIRTIFTNSGYGKKRPFLVDDGPYNGYEEVILGMFDAPKFSPDIIETDTGFISQITLGMREVF